MTISPAFTPEDMSPLELAQALHKELSDIEQCDMDVAQRCVEAGADLAVLNSFKDTALITAAHFGLHGLLALMIEKGGDVNTQGQNGDTALMAAVKRGRASCLELLVKHGAQDIPDDKGRSIASFANPAMLEILNDARAAQMRVVQEQQMQKQMQQWLKQGAPLVVKPVLQQRIKLKPRIQQR